MATLNAFLEAAGGHDGDKLLPFMTEQLRSQFATTAQIWGQGDFDHVGWQVTAQSRISDTEWEFQVTESCRDWGGGGIFYNHYAVGMIYRDGRWQVSRFDFIER